MHTLTGDTNSKGKGVNILERSVGDRAKGVIQAKEGNSQRTIQVTDELIGKKSTPPFLLTFKIFNPKVSNV